MLYCPNNVAFSVSGMNKAPKFYWVLDITEVYHSMDLKTAHFDYIEGLRSRNESAGAKCQR